MYINIQNNLKFNSMNSKMLLFQVLTTSISSGTLNPEAHEFKYKSSVENPSKSGEESNGNNPKNGKKNKGNYDLNNNIINYQKCM